MKNRILNLSIFLLIILNNNCFGQKLKRIIDFGISSIEINDSIMKDKNLPIAKGLLIKKVKQSATASSLNLLASDLITEINHTKIYTKKEYKDIIKSLREGDEITVKYFRNNKPFTTTGKAIGKKLETSNDYQIIYDKVQFDKGFIRTIITKPKGINKAPAILFIPGFLCYSLDNQGKHPYAQLVDKLTKKGYVVLRVEKLGEGDCWNTPKCDEIDFLTELQGYEKGLQSLKKYDFIDVDNIFIWGHSVGAIETILLAEKNKVKGIIVNGTTHSSWYEYLLKMVRFQQPLFDVDYLEIEEKIKLNTKFQFEYLVLKKTPSELSKNKEYERLLQEQQFDGKDKIYGRNYKFWQQLQDVNQTNALKNSNAHVLSIWSSADIEAFSENEHKTIVDIVNYYHKGKGTYIKLPNTTHAFVKVKSIKEGVKNHSNYKFITSNFNPEIIEITHSWIQKIINN